MWFEALLYMTTMGTVQLWQCDVWHPWDAVRTKGAVHWLASHVENILFTFCLEQ